MWQLTWLVVVAIAASLHIWADAKGKNSLCYLFKPLTTILVILYFASNVDSWGLVAWLLLFGLLFSLLGDIFLMLPNDRFVPGLASFLVAHLLYIVAFIFLLDVPEVSPVSLLAVLYAIAFLFVLWPKLGEMRIPVLLYALVIMLMLAAAIEVQVQLLSTASLLLLLGAISFVYSDSLIATKRFFGAKPWHEPTLLATYYLAQGLITTGVLGLLGGE